MLLLLALACGTGITLFGLLKMEFDEGAETLVLSFATGTVFFSLVLLAMGKAGFFSGQYIIAASVAVAAISLTGQKKLALSLKTFFNQVKTAGGLFMLIIWLILLARLAIVFFSIFIPITGWDTTAYHYAIPRFYLNAGKIFYIPFMYHSNWPELMEMIYAWAMVLHSDLLANGTAFLYAFFLLTALFLFGFSAFNPRAGLIAAVVISAFYLFQSDSANGYVDTALAFFELACVYAIFRLTVTGQKKYLIAGAVCAAGAASIKILGLFPVAALPLFLLFRDYFPGNKEKKIHIMEALIFVFLALLIASPWYIKSFVDTGNPVWPFAYGIFGGRNWSKELSDYRNFYYALKGTGIGIVQLLKLPIAMASSAGMDGFMGNNIVYFYLSLPFIIYTIARKKSAAQIFLLLYSFCFICFWAINAQMTRFFFPGLAVITVMCAGETERILYGTYNKALKVIFAAVLFYLLLYSFSLKNVGLGIKCFTGITNRQNYLESSLDYYKLFEKVNKDDSVIGKIAFFREIRGYYLKKDYIWADPVNQGLISYKNTQQTLKQLNDNMVKFIIYNNNAYGDGKDGYSSTVYGIMNEIISKYSEQMYCFNNVCLYRLKSQDVPR